MRWTKIILLFQAIVTLILGMVFFWQVLTLDAAQITELKIQVEDISSPDASPTTSFIDIKQRYSSASYILLFISLIELVIITKLLT